MKNTNLQIKEGDLFKANKDIDSADIKKDDEVIVETIFDDGYIAVRKHGLYFGVIILSPNRIVNDFEYLPTKTSKTNISKSTFESQTRCTCGTHATYGDNCKITMHSDWCDINK